MGRIATMFSALILGTSAIVQPATAQDQKLFVPKPTAGVYAKSYALIIGNSDYDHLTDLKHVVTDMVAVRSALEAQGFQVEPEVSDANGAGLRETIDKFVNKYGYEEGARVLIWFAGHGVTVNGEGYLLGTDAPVINPDKKETLNNDLREFYAASMPLRSFGTILRQMRSLHVMVVLDSCFAATIFSTTRANITRAREIEMRNPTRQIITSGGVGQRVADDGKFAQVFADAITGKSGPNGKTADLNGDRLLSGTELGAYLAFAAETPLQKPQYGKLPSANAKAADYASGIDIGNSNFEEGEFFFQLGGASEPVASPPQQVAVIWRDLADGIRIAAGVDPAPVYAKAPPDIGEKQYALRSGENFPPVGVNVKFQSATIGEKQWLRFEQDHILYYVLEGDVTIKRPN